MDGLFPYLIFILALITAMSIAIMVYALRRRHAPGAMPFAILMLAIATWASAYAIELNDPSIAGKVFWLKVSWFGIVTLPSAWLIFVLQYTGREKWGEPSKLILLTLEPVLILILIWTNDFHHMFWRQLEPQMVSGVSVFKQAQGSIFWLNMAYSYILTISGAFLMLRTILQGTPASPSRAVAFLIAPLAPLLVNLFSLTNSPPFSYLFLPPLGFLITDTVALWAIVNFQFLEIVPLANRFIIESMADGLVIVDAIGKIVYLNPAACRILNRPSAELLGKPASQLLPDWASLQGEGESRTVGEHRRKEIVIEAENGRSYYELQISALSDLSSLVAGRVLLWHDITQRKIAEQESQASQERLKQLVENSPNPIFSIDRRGVIQTWNHACGEIFEYGQEIVGQEYQKILSENQNQTAIQENLAQIFGEGASFTNTEIIYRCKDGSIRKTTSRLYPLFDQFGNVESCVFANTDITERIEAEQVLRRQLEELKVLHAVAAACAEADDEDALIEAVTQIIGDAFFPDNFGLILLEEGSNLLYGHPSYREKDGTQNSPYPLGTGITGQVAHEGRARRVADISQDIDYFAVDQETRSELCVPLKAGEHIIGVINTESSHLNAFSPKDEQLLSILADQIAVAIERLRDGAFARQRVQELLAISRISYEITSRLDRQQVLDSIARHAAQISNSAASGLFLYQTNDELLGLVATYGVGEQFIRQINTLGVPLKGTAVGRAITSRQPFQINDIHKDATYATTSVANLEKIQSVLALPMLRGEEVIGGIVIWDRRVRVFTPEEERFMQALANQSVNAIENSRLYEAERQGRKMAEALRETGSELSATLDYESVLDRLLDQVARLVPYDGASVLMVEDDHIRVARASGYQQFGDDFSYAIDKLRLRIFGTEILNHMSVSRQPLIIADTSSYPGWVAVDDEIHLRSWIGAPVIFRDEIIAFFSLEKIEAGFYQAEHVERLSTFAGQAGLALQNAHLFAETRRRAAQQEALNKIIAAAVEAPDLPYLLETVLDLSLMAVGLDMGGLWVSDYHALRGLPDEIGSSSSRIGQHTGRSDSVKLVVKDWEQIQDSHPLAIWKDHMQHFQVRATLFVPVLAAGRQIGALSLASSTPKEWSHEEIALAEAIGQQIGGATLRLDLLSKTREQAQQVQQIIDTVPEGVILLDAEHDIVLVNPVAQAQLRDLLASEQLDQPILRLGNRPVESFIVTDSGKSWHELQTEITPRRIFEIAARPLEVNAQDGGLVLVLRDVTIERENQTRTQMQERLVTVGQLAAGIAHDFNNIMAAVVVYTDLLAMDPNLTQTSQEQLHIIQQQVQRATSLIRQILDFSRRAVIEQIPLDLLPFIKELDKLLIRVLPENISLELAYQPGIYFVKADATRLQQAVMNLALNGRDAMPLGGSLHFALERISFTEDNEIPLPDLTPGEWIRLTVKDTGAGIPAEILPHIFDPFFTTKPAGKGTGLGLAQAYGIIKQHGGCIDVHSEIDRGTSFMIYLPALEMPEEETPENQPGQVIPGKGETVLVVEDDRAARQALISLLESQNYRTLAAQNGLQALEIFEREQEAIDVVVSDVVMPEMGGVALYKALREKKPLIKMLFITGHPLDFKDQVMLETGRAHWLQKPFSVLEFTSVMRILLQDIS